MQFGQILAAALLSAVTLCAGEITVGAPAPAMKLKDMSGKSVAVNASGKVTVVTFISTKCPISNDYNDRMIAVYKEYANKGVNFYFVNANFTESAAEIAEHKQSVGFPFAVYQDGDAADQLGAQVTPEAFVFNAEGKLVYHGYVDDSRNAARVTKNGLRDALDATLAGKPVPQATTKAFGCTIKRPRKS
ncbi:MAG: redoxin domain-containing protein [Bryobacter sp.]|nr:redoxin domain-containing protein [Bryobacter sp.]